MKPEIQSDIYLRDKNTFQVQAVARHFIKITEEQQIRSIDISAYPGYLILGGGSNVLFVNDVEGLVIHNSIAGKKIISLENKHVVIEAGGGENWHELVLWALAQNFGGIENLSLIPGTVGAAPMQNIGAYGVELRDVFVSLEAVEVDTGKCRSFDKEECEFGYRTSIFKREFKDRYLITKARLKLTTRDHPIRREYGSLNNWLEQHRIEVPTIHHISKAVISIRKSKLPDPAVIGNAGSFFKNPVIPRAHFEELSGTHPGLPWYTHEPNSIKIAAAWLIEQCGWKGVTVGRTGTYKYQPLVLVNHGGATGKEIYELSEQILESVKEKFNITLEREVNIIE